MRERASQFRSFAPLTDIDPAMRENVKFLNVDTLLSEVRLNILRAARTAAREMEFSRLLRALILMRRRLIHRKIAGKWYLSLSLSLRQTPRCSLFT